MKSRANLRNTNQTLSVNSPSIGIKSYDVSIQKDSLLSPEIMAIVHRVHAIKDHHILRLPEASKKMGRAHSTLWRDVKLGKFATPIRIGDRAVGWLKAEVDAILEVRAISARSTKPINMKQFISALIAPRSTEPTQAFSTKEK